ncbi:uncharacterized protein [Anoplolepis gracilipes]|uniref:uncharacterized protein n=1 Tax=Anoplolepis gracilipes TaxID=354296 RepID=UPI003BA272BC
MYLGHIISENGISPDLSKLTAIKKFPTPKRMMDVQSFIGLAGYYRRYIVDFSKIARPLAKLTKKTKKFLWTAEQQNARKAEKGILPRAMTLNDNKIDYVHWNDLNELVDRLRLLDASRRAGNNTYDNEIMSIIEELREDGLIIN